MIPNAIGHCIKVEKETYPGSGRMHTVDSGWKIGIDFGEGHGKVFDHEGNIVRDATPEEIELALSKREFIHYMVYASDVVSYHQIKLDPYWADISLNAKAIIKTFLDGERKIIGSPTVLLDLLKKHNFSRDGVPVVFTLQDVQDAYDICYGDGCEYEWEYP